MAPEHHSNSYYGRRRREPLYFQMRAVNALRCASVLENAALLEGFWREASLSLELITKAVIAQRLQAGEDLGAITRVPVTHNVPQLWTHAQLPDLQRDDRGRLIRARVYLMWAGRYAAPNRDEDGERDDNEVWENTSDPVFGVKLFRTPHSFKWQDVDRIFSVANTCFFEIRIAHGLSQRDGDIIRV